MNFSNEYEKIYMGISLTIASENKNKTKFEFRTRVIVPWGGKKKRDLISLEKEQTSLVFIK